MMPESHPTNGTATTTADKPGNGGSASSSAQGQVTGQTAGGVPGAIEDVLQETTRRTGNFTSTHKLSQTEALEAGIRFVGPGYREIGKPGSGVFRSADGLRRFRIDDGSLAGTHAPGVPHVHFEVYATSSSRFPVVNNHVPVIP
jgi:filamentous hemagglutinin